MASATTPLNVRYTSDVGVFIGSTVSSELSSSKSCKKSTFVISSIILGVTSLALFIAATASDTDKVALWISFGVTGGLSLLSLAIGCCSK